MGDRVISEWSLFTRTGREVGGITRLSLQVDCDVRVLSRAMNISTSQTGCALWILRFYFHLSTMDRLAAI